MWNSLAESGNCHIPEAVYWHGVCFFCVMRRGRGKKGEMEGFGEEHPGDVNGLMGMKLRR